MFIFLSLSKKVRKLAFASIALHFYFCLKSPCFKQEISGIFFSLISVCKVAYIARDFVEREGRKKQSCLEKKDSFVLFPF